MACTTMQLSLPPCTPGDRPKKVGYMYPVYPVAPPPMGLSTRTVTVKNFSIMFMLFQKTVKQ